MFIGGIVKIGHPFKEKRSDARVKEITNYIEGGFPWSTLTREQQRTVEHAKLKMPGLLPTAIIINILLLMKKGIGKILRRLENLYFNNR